MLVADEQKHAWPLQEAWITRKRREKRKNECWISCLSHLYFFSFSSLSLFHVNILLYLHKRSSGDRFLVYVCFPKTRNLSSLLTTLQEAMLLKFLEHFCQGRIACNGQLYFQLLWDAYSGTLDELSLLFSQGMQCSSVPTSKLYMSALAGRSNWLPTIDSGTESFPMKRPTHCRQWDVQVLVSVDIYRSWKIR